MLKGFSIAIDGPVAAGKGTIAPLLAKQLNGFYLYTGSMYRALTLLCIEKGIDVFDKDKVINILPEVKIELFDNKVFLNKKDITQRLNKEDVARKVSIVSVYPEARKEMVKKQREIAIKNMDEGKIVVAEGRDTGTKILPDSAIKIFLTANEKVRAERRLFQLIKQGYKIGLEEVLEQIKKRDKQDKERKADPLTSSPEKSGYFIVDNSNLNEEETVEVIIEEIKKRGLIK